MLRRVLPALMFLLLLPLQAHAWWNSDFSTRKKISFNTSAQGVEITSDQSFVPVLVRLHTGNFAFADAKPDGADLRFVANDDKSALKYHIESFDGVNELASVWVQVPKIAAHQTADYIWVYYGSEKASAGDDVKGSFDPGYAAVLHLNETPARDATGNAVLRSTRRWRPGRICRSARYCSGFDCEFFTPSVAAEASASGWWECNAGKALLL